MHEIAMRRVLDSFAKVGKQCGMGESVGRIWGFLLLKSCPITQKEIEEGTGYSRGLISHCLQGMEERTVVDVNRRGREIHYSLNSSLAASFGELVGRQYEDRIKLMIEFLTELSDTIEDEKVRASSRSLINEYKKLSLAFLLFPKIIDGIRGINMEATDIKEAVERITIVVDNDIKR